MDLFWKAAAAVLITIILMLALERHERDIAVLLTITMCCMLGIVIMNFLDPVLSFLYELETLSFMDRNTLKLLLKLIGIGLIAEITALICTDAGCGSLGKSLQLLASAVIFYLSIPVFQALITVIQEILGGL